MLQYRAFFNCLNVQDIWEIYYIKSKVLISVSIFVSHPKWELPNIKINRVIQIMSHWMIYNSIGKNISLAEYINTLRTGDADLRFYITIVQYGWCKSVFLTHACFPCTIHLIMQYIEPVSEWSCWRIFIETWPHSELTFRHRASSI